MKRPDLRLVPNVSATEESVAIERPRLSKCTIPENYQLSLPFADQQIEKVIVITSVDNLHGTRFCSIISGLRPKIVVDLRYLIRFDLPGTNRQEIFECFRNINSLYVKASLPWHELKPSDFTVSSTILSHQLNHEVVERKESPVMLLTSKSEEGFYLTSYVNRMLSLRAKYPWQIEQIS